MPFPAVRLLTVVLLLLGFTLPLYGQARDTSDLAAEIGPQLHALLKAKLPETARVAVMPFSNGNGRVSAAFSEHVTALQGELINALKTQKAGLVLDKKAIQKSFTSTATDPSSLDMADPAGTADVLKSLKWDVVIMGKFNADDPTQLAKQRSNDLNFSLTVIFQDGSVERPEFTGNKNIIPEPKTPTRSGRFNVEILVGGRPLPLLTDTSNDSAFHNVLFLQVPQSLVGREYQIRLTNKGTPQVGYQTTQAPEENRLFAAAVLIDGIDSFARQSSRPGPDGKPLVDFAQVHPKNAHKWLLTSPGKAIRPTNANPEGFIVQSLNGPGHSVATISGFQMNEKEAAAFTFAKTGEGETAAELIGVTEDIGLITVYFYPQKLPGDRVLPSHGDKVAGLGTKPGRTLEHGVVKVKPNLHQEPVEIWRIFYRAEGDLPVPSQNLAPFVVP